MLLAETLNANESLPATPARLSKLGVKTVVIQGTFDGATVTLEVSADGTVYAPMADVAGSAIALTAAGSRSFQYTGGLLRATMSSVGAGSDVDVHILGDGDN